jgi:hypothetical protein
LTGGCEGAACYPTHLYLLIYRTMPELDIAQALHFLDMLDPKGRHTIASEAPFGRYGKEPKWEGGATFEAHHRQDLIDDIRSRQARKSNVYYSVNRPCSIIYQQGYNGKCGSEDIIAVRALAFDADLNVKNDNGLIKAFLAFIDTRLNGALRPSLVINTGGGFQLIYLLNEVIEVSLFRSAEKGSEQENHNIQVERLRAAVSRLAHEFEALLRSLVPADLIKIDNMSNLDRVMRLPGTVNYPKAEKIANGQVEALAHIAVDYQTRCDIRALRKAVPERAVAPPVQPKRHYVPRPNEPSVYDKAKICCEFIRDCGAADTNEWYANNLMLPLLGEVREGSITLEQGEDLFLEAVSGGERYGSPGRGLSYFRRQWRSHIHSSRNGRRHLGSLIKECMRLGMKCSWADTVKWERDFLRQQKELSELKQTISDEDIEYVKRRRQTT